MKKSLSIFLALLMILSSLPIMTIGASAETSSYPNALENYKAADWFARSYGSVSDSQTTSKGGNSYYLSSINYQKLVTTVTLEPNSNYEFNFDWRAVKPDDESGAGVFPSHIYVYPKSIVGELTTDRDANATAGSGKWNTNAVFYPTVGDGKLDSTDDIETKSDAVYDANKALLADGTWRSISTTFNTTEDTEYVIMIGFRANSKGQGKNQIILSDFSLVQNLLGNATNANGRVTWTDNSGVYSSAIDKATNSVYGGHSWRFGIPETSYKNSKIAYIYIKTGALTAGKSYDFSYIYQKDYIISLDSIKDKDNNAVSLLNDVQDVSITGGDRAHKVSGTFLAPADGDYTITLSMCKGKNNTSCGYDSVILCDLALYQYKTVLYDVSVSAEGNGFAKASKSGYVSSNETVTFTATPMDYESFLGWYDGETLLSEDLIYSAEITSETKLVAKFTANSENVFDDYTAAEWRAWRYSSIADDNSSLLGGNGYKVTQAQYQKIFTVVTLEKNTSYRFSFNWKAILSSTGDGAFPSQVYVIPRSKMGTTEQVMNADKNNIADSQWASNDSKFTVAGETEYFDFGANDIEESDCHNISKALATNTAWNSFSTKFTTVDEPEYVIVLHFSRATDATDINLSDLVLKKEVIDESNLMANKDAADWGDHRYSKISDSTESRFGGNGFLVEQAMYQNVFTGFTLKPGTDYSFSFEWKSIANEGGAAYPAGVKIYPVAAGDPFDTDNTEIWNDNLYIPVVGFADLAKDVVYPEQESLEWQTLTGNFTTNEYDEYRMIIYFTRVSDEAGGYNNNQQINLSDFVLKEVVKGDAPSGDAMIAHPGVAIRKANESPNGQALRYKFTIDNNIIANALSDGYELVEYGTVVAYADDLIGYANDPILSANRYTVRTGVAYQKDFGAAEPTTNVQFDVASNGDVTYTVALYNIPLNKYSFNIAVRPYAKFQNAEGDTYIRYGTTRTASVFEVVKAILASDNTDDIDYVNNTILVDSVKDDYEAWITEN